MLNHIVFVMQFLREKKFKETIPQIKIEDGEVITHEKATDALRRVVHFFSALQATDGHWPAESTGPLFYLPPFVSHFFFSLSSHTHTHTYIYIYIEKK